MNSLGIVIGSQTAANHARSALPRSPVIEQPAATLMRRIVATLRASQQS